MVKDYSKFAPTDEEKEAMKTQNPEKFAIRQFSDCANNLHEITSGKGIHLIEDSELIFGVQEIMSEIEKYYRNIDDDIERDIDDDVIQFLRKMGEKRQERNQEREDRRNYGVDESQQQSSRITEENDGHGPRRY